MWRALADIPYGVTVTYGELARRVGRPGASRAVGQANGANSLPVVIPCHRVVAAGGGLGATRAERTPSGACWRSKARRDRSSPPRRGLGGGARRPGPISNRSRGNVNPCRL
ncbi:MAG: methylated-DNA--[protein]-cysteine S-methyltransferase [Acidimicrobiales bacterium]